MTTFENEARAGERPGAIATLVSAALVAARVVAAARDDRRRPRPVVERQEEAGDGRVFRPHRHWNARQRRAYAAFEIAYTTVDFGAAFSFVVGSILFFYSEYQTEGTWMFLVGSILFALKPTIRLAREIVHVSLGRTDKVAKAMAD